MIGIKPSESENENMSNSRNFVISNSRTYIFMTDTNTIVRLNLKSLVVDHEKLIWPRLRLNNLVNGMIKLGFMWNFREGSTYRGK